MYKLVAPALAHFQRLKGLVLWLFCAVVSSGAAADFADPGASVPQLALPPHPRLLLDRRGVVELKARIATASWARKSWADLKASAGKAMAKPLDLPPRGGNWSHNYVCPTHGARLERGKRIAPWQWEHFCPVGPHILYGNPSKASLDFDGNAMGEVHNSYAEQVISEGLLYQVTGDARYARRAREILVAYAERYLQYPLHDNQGKPNRGGHVASQSLSEASWLIDMAQGADLVWDTLSESDRDALEHRLFRPALDQVILRRPLGIHNIQCRHNSAIGLVGFLLGDSKLIAKAIDDPANGFRQQVEKGVLADGMWLEGASGYHFFTIAGLWPLAEAARNCGLNLYSRQFEQMFEGPLMLAMPNFVLPNFNDSGTVSLSSRADAYELAFARYHNPAFIPILTDSSRRGHLALLYGEPHLPPEPKASPLGTSHNSSSSGYAILRSGPGPKATWLCLKYGPHGGGHGHPDKNTFILYARGQIVATDGGVHAYGSPLHKQWDKTTLAHNTLVVDETSQARPTGKCLAFGAEHGVDFSVTDAGPIYDGVRFIRTAAMLTPQIILFVDQVRSDAVHTYDLAYHQLGAGMAEDPPGAVPWMPGKLPGYNQLVRTAVRPLDSDGFVFKTALADNWHPSVFLAKTGPTEIITGDGILKSTANLVPVILQRRRAQDAAFAWAVSLDGAPVTLHANQVQDSGGKLLSLAEAMVVNVAAAGRNWSLVANPDARLVTVEQLKGNAWQTEKMLAIGSSE
jgi:oligo-alginate lyase